VTNTVQRSIVESSRKINIYLYCR